MFELLVQLLSDYAERLIELNKIHSDISRDGFYSECHDGRLVRSEYLIEELEELEELLAVHGFQR